MARYFRLFPSLFSSKPLILGCPGPGQEESALSWPQRSSSESFGQEELVFVLVVDVGFTWEVARAALGP